MSDLPELRAAVRLLIGKKFSRIGRAGTMLWLGFGIDVPWIDYKGTLTHKSELSLDVQSEWRILSNASVFTTRADINSPSSNLVGQFKPGGAIGSATFDERVLDLNRILEVNPIRVLAVAIEADLALHIECGNGIVIEVLPNEVDQYENWRLIQFFTDSRHYVAMTSGH